jgi:hypothetical protein
MAQSLFRYRKKIRARYRLRRGEFRRRRRRARGAPLPADSGIQYAWFSNESFDRLEALSSFTQLAVAEGEKQSVPVLAAYDASRIVLGTTSVYGGSRPRSRLPAMRRYWILLSGRRGGASGALTYQTLPADFPQPQAR